MRCQEEEEQICGHGDIYMTYFCLFNQLELRLESRINSTYASLLVKYQVLHGLTRLLLEETHSQFIYPQKFHRIPLTFRLLDFSHLLQSYRYTIKSFYRFTLEIRIFVYEPLKDDMVFVDIFDGPILVNSSPLHEMHGFRYVGGFTITCQVDVIKSTFLIEGRMEIVFQMLKQTITDVNLVNPDDTYNTSVNTMQRSKTLYYKYIRVKTASQFVKLTFTKIRTFAGQSYGCEYGGFVVSDFWNLHVQVLGPYCTQHGTEPLVNDVTTFHSRNPFLTLIIYSYTFQMDVDISFQSTPCEGVTNPCIRYCGNYSGYNQKFSTPVNFVRLSAYASRFFCRIQLQIVKECIKVQRISDNRNAVCITVIHVRLGVLQTSLQIQNKFR